MKPRGTATTTSWLYRLGTSLVRGRRWWAAGLVGIFLAALPMASRLDLHNRVEDFLPRPVHPGNRTGPGLMVAILEANRVLSPAEAGPVLDDLSTALQLLPGIATVRGGPDSIVERMAGELARRLPLFLSVPALESLSVRLGADSLAARLDPPPNPVTPLHAGDPLGIIGMAARAVAPRGQHDPLRRIGGYLALPDRRAFILGVELSEPVREVSRARQLVESADSVLARIAEAHGLAERGLQLSILGRPVALARGYELALRDAGRVTLAAALVVPLVLLVLFRKPWVPVLVMITVGYGLVLAGAAAQLVFGSVSLVAWMFIAVLIGLGDEYALYILTHYWIHGAPEPDRAAAIGSALVRPGPGILLGGACGTAAFLSLTAMSYPVLRQVGWITGFGLVALLAASFTLLPFLLTFTPPRADPAAWSGRLTTALHQPHRGPAASIAPWLLVVGLAVWGASGIRIETHPWTIALRGHTETAHLDLLERRAGASLTPVYMVSSGATEQEALERDRAAVLALVRRRHLAGVATVLSLSRLLPPNSTQRAASKYLAAHPHAFSSSRVAGEAARAVVAGVPPARLDSALAPVRPYLDPEGSVFGVHELAEWGGEGLIARHLRRTDAGHEAVSVVHLVRSPWAEGVIDRFLEAVNDPAEPALSAARFEGEAFTGGSHQAALRRDVVLATLVTAGAVLVLLSIRFRRSAPVLLCLVPVACGLAVALGVMRVLGVDLNVLTLAIAPLLIGLGVDDGVHIVDRLGGEPEERIAVRETGTAMAVTNLTTAAGFLCLAFASFPGIAKLGVVAAAGLLTCLLASLHLVPALHRASRGER